MTIADLHTPNLRLVPQTREEIRALIEAMSPSDKAQLSADWLARFHASAAMDPWVHGFRLVHRDGGFVGTCSFKGPPTDGMVEIAYGVASGEQGKGYATEAARALVAYAFTFRDVRVIRAHTLPEAGASRRVLAKCGFRHVGEVIDPEDGLVWRFEKAVGDEVLPTVSPVEVVQ
jgi:RimJ/RimL family protein N-acetyltransferase